MQLRALLVLAAGFIGALSPLAYAQDYPSRPIRMVVPFGPGTSTDITGRIFAQGLSQQLKQTIVVENKPGAGGNIGTELVAKAPPNGYTLSFGTVGTLAINAALLATSILSISRPDLRKRLHAFRAKQTKTVLAAILP